VSYEDRNESDDSQNHKEAVHDRLRLHAHGEADVLALLADGQPQSPDLPQKRERQEQENYSIAF